MKAKADSLKNENEWDFPDKEDQEREGRREEMGEPKKQYLK